MRIVILGNGVAGIEAALTVRRRQPDWDVTIVSEESDHFFSRTALMWVFTGQLTHQQIEPYERDLYERMGFRRVRARAVGLDAGRKRLHLAGEQESLAYDRLLIACGSRPRPPPWPRSDLRGIGHFVTLQDLEWFEREVHRGPSRGGRPPRPDHHVQHTTDDSPYLINPPAADDRGRPCTQPAVIGGGLIGIESVEVLVNAGYRPHFFIREEWFWPMAVDRSESTWIAERMREHGVQVHLEHEIEGFEGDDRGAVHKVKTNRGDYDADLVVVCIGVVPNTGWMDGTELALQDGSRALLVDQGLAASTADVFAAGDCAAVTWFDGRQRPEQLWYTARDQGRVAGRRLLGDDVRYDRGTWYNSAKLMDMEYTTAGLVSMGLEGEREWFYEETSPVRSTTRIVVQDGAVIGFNLLGRRWDHTVLVRWIEERRSLPFVVDHLDEARFDTEFVPPLRITEAARREAEAL